jgi:hypothetical protein
MPLTRDASARRGQWADFWGGCTGAVPLPPPGLPCIPGEGLGRMGGRRGTRGRGALLPSPGVCTCLPLGGLHRIPKTR